jgi:hypothetical protein
MAMHQVTTWSHRVELIELFKRKEQRRRKIDATARIPHESRQKSSTRLSAILLVDTTRTGNATERVVEVPAEAFQFFFQTVFWC